MKDQTVIEDLVARAQDGDRQAMNSLIGIFYKRIYHFVWRYTGNQSMAEDVTQSCFISVFRSLPKVRERNKIKSWIYRIALNEANLQLRQREKNEVYELSTISDRATRAINSQQRLEQKERTELVCKALLLLNPDQRKVIIMKEYEGLKFREISQILEVPIETVKSRMYYGLKTLRKTLKNHPIIKDMYNEAS